VVAERAYTNPAMQKPLFSDHFEVVMSGCWKCLGTLTVFGLFMLARITASGADAPMPGADEIADLLKREPVTSKTWPAWRARFLGWSHDRSHAADAAFNAARDFIKGQVDAAGELPAPLSIDAYAWYTLGRAYLEDWAATPEGRQQGALAVKAEKANRRSIQLNGSLAQAHRNLALAILLQEPVIDEKELPPPFRPPVTSRQPEAERELAAARKLDPSLPLKWVEARSAFRRKSYLEASLLFGAALSEDPDEASYARGAALCIIYGPKGPFPRAPRVESFLDRFPDDGFLVTVHALALAEDGDARSAVSELKRARLLGTDPAQVLSAEIVQKIEEEGSPGLIEQFGRVMGGFAAFYAVVMGLMSVTGFMLARRTRGTAALDLVASGDELVSGGQVVRARHESSLARFYALALFAGLILFYISIPFIVGGLLALTALLVYLIYSAGRIPVKLVVVIVVMGIGGTWAVLKSLFASPGRGSFGLPKTPEQCPKLYQALADVAARVDTTPVDQVYLAPGSSIGVHQEGRGPFGVFGVKRRVLTLGLSTMHFLTVDELKSILAHEYAHFSHADTFYNRFIYQVSLSIQGALNGMGASGGTLNFVNPFFWFLYLYHRAYLLLSAGFSRSREFLADRMAATLYGPEVFTRALTKVSTDGALFEMTIYGNIGKLLEENRSFVNMYSAFRSFRDEQIDQKARGELYQKLLDEKESLFASHPTFKERIAAVAELPKSRSDEAGPAMDLFEDPEQLEKELTDFMTGYVQYMRQLAAQAQHA
jgi:Zn-dependent protease with chaperone function